tara:strand:- start:198 stop:1199 length:1002 start_codon:yes stop_codon:yes gene_type:complete
MKTYIIAEAGVNHNGRLNLAYNLVNTAKKIKANCVKFQLFKHNYLTTKFAPQASYQKKNTKKKQTQFELLKRLELNTNNLIKIQKYCEQKKIDFLLSVFGIEELKIIKKLKLKTVKLPSGEINNLPLLKGIARSNLNLILSTGMANMKEITFTLNYLKKNGLKKNKISILQCTTDYPTKLNDVNLRAMKTLQQKFKVKVGLSDHTIENESSISAVAMGATIIEKHLTLNNHMSGPDHKASLNPKKFKELINSIRKVEILLGSGKKLPSKAELKIKKIVRKSIVAKLPIKKGEIFTDINITCKRPEGGISASNWEKVVGKKSTKNFSPDEFIKL